MMRQYELVERVTRYNPNADENLLNKAYVYAMQKHGTQPRANGDPYFSHPLEVAGILTDLKLDDATIAVALLHDTIEDTDATRAEIDQMFGEDIGALVEGLTKISKLDLVSKRAEQAENLRKLLLAISSDIRVLLVKLADRLHNMRTLQFMPVEARARIAQETLEIYAPLAGRMGMHDMREELEDLAFRTVNPEAYATIQRRLAEFRARNRTPDREHRAGADRAAGEGRHRGGGEGAREAALFDLPQDGAQGDQLRAALRHSRLPRHRRHASPSATRRSASCTPPGRRCPGASRTTFRRRSRTTTARSTRRSSVPAASASNCRCAPPRCTASPNTASPPTRSTRTAWRRPRRRPTATATVRAQRQRQAKGGNGRGGFGAARLQRGDPRLRMAAADHRDARRGRHAGGVPRAHQARAVSGPGVLLHPEGPADRAAARRHADRLRLCGPHRHRRHHGRRQDQRPHHAADDGAQERRRGGDPALEGAGAAAGVGIDGGHRQGALGHPPRHAGRGAQAVCRPRPADRRAGLRPRRARLFRPADRGGPAAAGAEQCRGHAGGGRARRDPVRQRAQGGLSRPQGRAHACAASRRRGRRLVRPQARLGHEVPRARPVAQGTGGRARSDGPGHPDPRHPRRDAGAFRRGRRDSGRTHRRHHDTGRGDHHLSDPVAGAEGVRRRAGALAGRALGRGRGAPGALSRRGSR